MAEETTDGPVEIILEGDEPVEEQQEEEVVVEEEGEETPPEEGDEEKPLREKNGRFKGGAQGRIGELTRLRHDAERRAAAAEARLAEIEGTATHNGAKPGTAAAKPTPDQFEDYGDYVEALTDWKVAERETSNASKARETASNEVAQHREAEWGAKVESVRDILPDYAEVAEKSDVMVAPHVGNALQDAERGPELVYHLAKNPEIADRLNQMSPARAAMELGRIEASLDAQEAPPARKTTTAPPPITPVTQGAANAKDPSKMSMDEYTAFRKAQGLR